MERGTRIYYRDAVFSYVRTRRRYTTLLKVTLRYETERVTYDPRKVHT